MSSGLTFRVSHLKTTWVHLEPESQDVEAWSRTVLSEKWQLADRKPTQREWDESVADLLSANQISAAMGGIVYAYWPSFDLTAQPLATFMDSWPLTDGSFSQLAELAGVADADNVAPSEASVFETPSGDAVRVLSYKATLPDASGAPDTWTLTYAWCLPGMDGSIVLLSGGDMAQLPTVIDAIDGLARGLLVTRDGERLVATRRLRA